MIAPTYFMFDRLNTILRSLAKSANFLTLTPSSGTDFTKRDSIQGAPRSLCDTGWRIRRVRGNLVVSGGKNE